MAELISVRRGDFIVVSLPGDYGKPRPALVVQSDIFSALPSAAVCPVSSFIRSDADLIRLAVEPSLGNGLKKTSQIIIDKITTMPLIKISQIIGHADETLMVQINRALALFLGLNG